MTLSKLTWLKRTDGHKFTGAEFRVLVSIYNHSDEHGRKSHPGIDLMVVETGYRKTGISEAATTLKARGWIHETYKGNGLARMSSAFDLVPDAPNPGYTCPRELQSSCTTCSNSSAGAEPLTESHSSGVAVPIVPLERSPSDPVPDPRKGSVLKGEDDQQESEPAGAVSSSATGLASLPSGSSARADLDSSNPNHEPSPPSEVESTMSTSDPFELNSSPSPSPSQSADGAAEPPRAPAATDDPFTETPAWLGASKASTPRFEVRNAYPETSSPFDD